jgi:hypothetical protein
MDISVRAFLVDNILTYGYRFVVERNGEAIKVGVRHWHSEDAAIEAGMIWVTNNIECPNA